MCQGRGNQASLLSCTANTCSISNIWRNNFSLCLVTRKNINRTTWEDYDIISSFLFAADEWKYLPSHFIPCCVRSSLQGTRGKFQTQLSVLIMLPWRASLLLVGCLLWPVGSTNTQFSQNEAQTKAREQDEHIWISRCFSFPCRSAVLDTDVKSWEPMLHNPAFNANSHLGLCPKGYILFTKRCVALYLTFSCRFNCL